MLIPPQRASIGKLHTTEPWRPAVVVASSLFRAEEKVLLVDAAGGLAADAAVTLSLADATSGPAIAGCLLLPLLLLAAVVMPA